MILGLWASQAGAWGHEAHHLINELALDVLSEGRLKQVLMEDRRAVILAGSEPDDVFRSQYPAVEPERHFYELDLVELPDRSGSYGDPPLTREALDACGREHAGRLPIAVAELWDELVEALRRADGPKSRRVAGLLGHYVGDATMPFHATRNFDGQETGNGGVHFLIEVTFFHWAERSITTSVRRQVKRPDVVAGDARAVAMTLLREGIEDVPALLAIDTRAKRVGGPLAGRSGDVLSDATPILSRQIARACRVLAGLWIAADERAHARP